MSFCLTDDQWVAIKTSYRGMNLSMRCCSSPAIPKVSSLGARFFAHKSRAGCQTAPESPEHLQAKFINRRECQSGRLAGVYGGIGDRS